MAEDPGSAPAPTGLSGSSGPPGPPDPEVVADAVRRALAEDLRDVGDLTADTILPATRRARARLVARAALTVCGLPLARETFRQVDPQVRFSAAVDDGARVSAGTPVATVEGSARALLRAERTALNFLMRMSGVATAARAAVDEVAGTGATVLDTRKTVPGWRALDKYAVRCGGGANHRMGLWDAAMVKDTHLEAVESIAGAVAALRARGLPPERITVEVRDLDQLAQAIEAGAGRALLDNMSLETMRRAVERAAGRIRLEASGGLRPGALRAVAETGVDCLSVGWLTHSAPAADLAMEMEPGVP